MILNWSGELGYLGLQPLVRVWGAGTAGAVVISATARGDIDYDQIRVAARSGPGTQLQTVDSPVAGHLPMWDANGKLVDSGATAPGGGVGSGSVTSVSATVPSDFSVSVANPTTTPAIAITGGPTKAAIQQQSYVFAAETGSGNAFAVSLTPTPTLVAGSVVVFIATHANTGAATLAVNGGSAIAIKKNGNSTALVNGDIAANQIISALYDGTVWQIAAITIPVTIGFVMSTGATGTNVGPALLAPRAGTFTKCKLVTKASDGSTALTFTIKQNGVAVFSSSRTVAAGTAAGTVSTFTSGLTSNPLAVAADDVFTIDISSGTSSWAFTIQLES